MTTERELPIAPVYGSWADACRQAHGTERPPVPGTIAFDLDGHIVIYAGIHGWQRLRWWSHGRRLVMADLSLGEQEARRLYLRAKAAQRRERSHAS